MSPSNLCPDTSNADAPRVRVHPSILQSFLTRSLRRAEASATIQQEGRRTFFPNMDLRESPEGVKCEE